MIIQTQNFGGGGLLKSTYHSGVYDVPLRIHQFSEIVFVLEGSVEITVDGQSETARAGELAVISSFRTHAFHTPSYCRIWIGRFSGDFIRDFLRAPDSILCGERAVIHPRASLADYVRDSLPEESDGFVCLEPDPVRYRAFKALAYAVFEEYTRTVPYTKALMKSNALTAVLLYMSEHYRENISLSSVSRATGYHTGYISHCIAVIPGVSFRTLLNQLRIDYAKTLLDSTDWRIIDVALESGFSNERTFHRAFCDLIGVTPGEYRRKRRGASS